MEYKIRLTLIKLSNNGADKFDHVRHRQHGLTTMYYNEYLFICLFNLENNDIHKNETNMYNKNVLKRLFLVIHRRWVLFTFKYNNR